MKLPPQFRRVAALAVAVLSPGLAHAGAGDSTEFGLRILEASRSETVPPKPSSSVRRGEGSDVVARVVAAASQDSTGNWVYSYRVVNDAASPRGIWSFTLDPIYNVKSTAAPPTGWTVDTAFQHEHQIQWFCVDQGSLPPEADEMGPSPFDIAPGDSATFSFTSSSAPVGTATYYVQGFHTVPVIQAGADIDSALASLPSFLEDSVTGTVVGPGALDSK